MAKKKTKTNKITITTLAVIASIALTAIIVVFLAVFVFGANSSNETTTNTKTNTIKTPTNQVDQSEEVGFISGLFKSPDLKLAELEKDENNSTRIMLIGHGGGDHEGPNLADSVTIVNINFDKKTVTFLSLPRDLYIKAPALKRRDRINKIYERAVAFTDNNQIEALNIFKEALSEVIGMDIHYSARVSFSGFKEIVDFFGGIDIELEERFFDPEYPKDDLSGYTTFSLPAGPQTLDGDTALKFARSRHSSSDFDRSQRQHIIMEKLRDKAISSANKMNARDIRDFIQILADNFYTDLTPGKFLQFYMSTKDFKMLSKVIHDNPLVEGGFLYTPPRDEFDGAFVLLPNNASPALIYNYDTIQRYINLVFFAPEYFFSPVDIPVILNGTYANGLAGRAKDYIRRNGIYAKSVANAEEKPVEQTRLKIPRTTTPHLVTVVTALFPGLSVEYTDNPVEDITLTLGTDVVEAIPNFY